MDRDDFSASLDRHNAPTVDLSDPMNQGVELTADDPLPDIPDAGPDSLAITSPDPIDFSTKGITAAGSAGMSTFNDGDDQSFFERTIDVFEQSGIDSPMIGDEPVESFTSTVDAQTTPRRTTRSKIY